MMGDLRETVYGPRRTQIDDEHTVALYALYRDRTRAINGLLSLALILATAASVFAVAVGVAGVLWVWRAWL